MGDKPSQSPAATSSPSRGKSFHSGDALGKEGRFRPHSLTAERIQLLSGKHSAFAKASPFRERWHGEAVTERVSSGTNPLSLAALDSSPEGRALGKEGRFRPYSSTAERIQLLSCKLSAFAKASPFRERWHGEAVTERVSSGTNPLSLAALDSSFPFLSPAATSSPSRGKSFHSGDALGKEGRFRPYSSTAERIQLLSCKLFALAKASPFWERWHGEAVTERVAFRLTAAFGKRFFHGPAERPSSLESRY